MGPLYVSPIWRQRPAALLATLRTVFRAPWALLALMLPLLLAACENGPGSICSGETVDTAWSDCGANKLDDQPRLYTGEAARKGPVIDPSRLNDQAPKSFGTPFVGYYGSMRVDYSPEAGAVAADMAEARSAAKEPFDPEERVKIDLRDATVEFMLRQLIGGALKANYVAPDGLEGRITFRTEVPIPKAQLIEVVRDLLARQNLAITFLNGVYHVGSPDLITSLKQNGTVGRQGDITVRTMPIKGGKAGQVVQLANQIVPQTVRLLPSSDDTKIIIQATPAEIDQVVDLIQGLASYGGDSNRIAIIPITSADPQTVAGQVNQFYQAQFPELAGFLTLVALPEQQAVLAGVRKAEMMPDLARLIQQLDRNNAEPASIRVIPLQNISAVEAAEQLGKIFGDATAGGGGAAGVSGAGGGGAAGGETPAPGATARSARAGMQLGLQPQLRTSGTPLSDSEEDVGGDLRAPRVTLTPRREPGQQAIDNEGALDRVSQGFGNYSGGGAGPVDSPGATGGGGGGGGGEGVGGAPKFVANPRTNSLMVLSTYGQFRQIRDVLATIDVPQAQVVIEATVVEVDLNDSLDKGVQFFLEGQGWSFRSSRTTRPATQSGSGAVFSAGGDIGDVRADVVVSALQAVTRAKVISSPYLTVTDGRTARLNIGDQIPYTKTSQTSNNNGAVTVTQEIDIKDTGIILQVTPTVKADNSVVLDIQQQVSTPSTTAASGDTTPIIATRNIESNIMVQSGRTALLGGLIQDRLEKSETGVPVLRTIPVVGEVFKQNNDRMRRVELLVMITPRVIRQNSQLEDITRQLRGFTHTRPVVLPRGTP